jgi:hypothetical protein
MGFTSECCPLSMAATARALGWDLRNVDGAKALALTHVLSQSLDRRVHVPSVPTYQGREGR